jgi:hypothetical protein
MDKKISELTSASSLTATDILPIVQAGTNKKITALDVFGKVNVPVHVNQHQADQDTKISGQADVNLVFVDASTDRVGFGTNTPAEKVDVNGGLALNGRTRNASVTTQTSTGVIDLTTANTVLAIGSPATATIANGVAGQVKEIFCNGVGPVVLTATSSAFTSITFNAVGQTATLKFVSGKWYIQSVYGATVV